MKFLIVLIMTPMLGFAQPDSIAAHRARVDRDFADAGKSPLTEADRLHFKGLDYFAYDHRYAVVAKVTLIPDAKPFKMKTTTERLPLYREYARLDFDIDGKPQSLTVYQNLDLATKPGFRDYLFLPFMDVTSGNETYIGGRYLDLTKPTGNTILLDFNKAYNPYCAYNYQYSCPRVPAGNHLSVPILAGVQKFHE